MRPPSLRAALPWLIGLSLVASLSCVALAVYLGLAAETDATRNATRELAAQADTLVRQIEGDVALFDLALRDASNQARRPSRDTGAPAATAPFLALPLTTSYLSFINVLNEVGDVVADSRSNVSRPANFAGRDYFQNHLKNPADVLMIGRPFATAPNQHPSIPLSRRLTAADGSFAGVIVAGVHLAWLNDLLTRPSALPAATVAIRRDDGVILARTPFDPDAIGRGGTADPAWQAWLRTGLTSTADDSGGIKLFRRVGTPPLVLELAQDRAGIVRGQRSWLVWLPPLAIVPGLCVLGLCLLAVRLMRDGNRKEAAADAANVETMRLLSNMSHELRTPLTGILGQADMMADEGGLNAAQTTRLARMTEAGTLMRDIVNRVIDVARPGGAVSEPVFTPCDLDPLIRTCLGTVEVAAEAKGLHLTSIIDPSTPRRVMLARELVQQGLINLLMNAVKFTAKGTVALRVTGDAARLRFEVADTGPGIPAGKRRRLFRAYDRLDAPPSRTEGAGLGLSITERSVARMGGRIGHAENPGGGSVFWIELPTAEPGPPLPDPSAARDAPRAPPPEIRHLRVLLADDQEMSRDVAAHYLRAAGHVVTEVPDGESAIAEIQIQDFDVVLTDMRMPVVDGLEVTRRIRALPGHLGRTPVVLVTADLVALDRGRSGQTGVDACVRKPFTRGDLVSAVEAAARLMPVPKARLMPLPDARPADEPVLDEAAIADLKQSLDDASYATYLDAAAHRVQDLLVLLARPDATENPTVRDAVHDLIGVAGMLGFTALAACLRRFDIAADRMAPAEPLREAAREALRVLGREPELVPH